MNLDLPGNNQAFYECHPTVETDRDRSKTFSEYVNRGYYKRMWRSIFLHEFLDSNIRNFQAIAGKPTPSSLTLTPIPSPPLRTNAVGITPGRGFEYTLAQPLDQVIGISGRVRLRFPFQAGSDSPIPIMKVGEHAELNLLQKPLVAHSDFSAFAPLATVLLRIGSTNVGLGTVSLLPQPPSFFSELRFDWHTSGQARLLQDGRLVGYHNAVAPSVRLDVNNLVFGMPDVPLATKPNYAIGRVFVRVLRRLDALADFAKLLPTIPLSDPKLFEPCYLQAILHLLAMVDRLRQFMSLIHQKTSQPWTLASGPAEGPFRPEAIAAHDLATQAAIELTNMMRKGDFSTANAFLEPFEAFLRSLHDLAPEEFAVLAKDLAHAHQFPTDCALEAESILEKNRRVLGSLLDVLSKASDRLQDVAGGF